MSATRGTPRATLLREHNASVEIVRVPDCAGRSWYVSVHRNTVYFQAGMSPVESAQAVTEALLALTGYVHPRPLHLVPELPLSEERAPTGT